MPKQTFPALIGDIDTLAANLKGRLEEIPHLTPLQAELDAWLAEVRGLESQQEIFTARLRETNEKRLLAKNRGVELRGRAADGLRSHYGKKNKALHEFGVRPRRNLRSPARTQQPEPQPAPQPQPVAPAQSATPPSPVTPGSTG